METHFTPGPWTVEPMGIMDVPEGRPGIEAENQTIVLFQDPRNDRDDGGVFGRNPEQQMANARLIAKAPDMFWVMFEMIGELPWDAPAAQRARAIIDEVASKPNIPDDGRPK